MEYSKIEKEISDRLNAYFTITSITNEAGNIVLLKGKIKAQPGAQDNEEARRPMLDTLVSVAFQKTVPSETNSLNVVSQEETHHVEMVVQARQLRGDFGAYTAMDHIKRCLIGYRPEQSTTRMVADTGPEVVGKDAVNNSWMITMTVKFNALNTQAFEDESETEILLKKVIYQDG